MEKDSEMHDDEEETNKDCETTRGRETATNTDSHMTAPSQPSQPLAIVDALYDSDGPDESPRSAQGKARRKALHAIDLLASKIEVLRRMEPSLVSVMDLFSEDVESIRGATMDLMFGSVRWRERS